MDEFELIRRYFDRKPAAAGVEIGIGDDGAVLAPHPEKHQVQVIDTLVEGVHFPADTNPADIAYRAVAVNLSDIAAMGASPRWMTLALTLNNASETWVEAFASGLFEAADAHDLALVGGDTTSGPVVTVTVNITGELEKGSALLRSGGRVGDTIFVTGTLGDASAGLALLQKNEPNAFLVQRFLRPTARIATGKQLLRKASAAIDISDGLLGDLRKLLSASKVGGEIDIEKLPLSDALCERFGDAERQRFALTGGDDYELCFTGSRDAVRGIAGITAIGTVTASPRLVCRLHNEIVQVDDSGYRHFR
ncbi:MAG: thiamine-phosphate kinase [Gammaproteobacteria bacterium]|nr:thiamine-phosphate kinase [Gammaproteobacteria bacterium]MDH5239398.1 thiamine-phosphate kinase [Gammaproteobacteria bacterium]MDH5260516.1 thiamine-phosphate kinase [Gammaproteobacteria bacterium]MDH5584074.1 thiamine-phosphate kinase [Gammaproteobacteria bacterium]